jgi:NADH-quinone oxidoreductase subunit N
VGSLVAPVDGKLFGGMYQTDSIRNVMKLTLDLGTMLIMMMATGWIKKAENQDKISEFFILVVSTLLGMDFMISSGDFLMLYLGLEIATIPLTALSAFDRYKRQSAEAGIKYILSSALSSAILLFGLSMIYGTTGSTYFDVIQSKITPDALTMLGMVFFVSGMSFKISLVPFHLWTADVYEGSPIPVTAYLSVVSKGSAAFVFTWVLYNVFGQSAQIWSQLLVTLSVLTMTVGNLFALRQENMKRYLAFSSIAQAGFIILGILAQSQLGMASVVYFLMAYMFTNIAAFAVVATIADKTGKEQMSDYNGLYKTNPKLTLVLMLALFSLAGIPPVVGFFSKLFLFNAAASKGYYWLIFIAVLNATISLYYYLRPVRAMFIEKNDNPIATFKSDGYMRLALIVCVLGIFLTGFMSFIFEYIISVA